MNVVNIRAYAHRELASARKEARKEIDAVIRKVEKRLARVASVPTAAKNYAPRVAYTAKVKKVPDGLQPRPAQVLGLLAPGAPMTPRELARKIRVTENSIKGAIHYLRKKRLVAVHRYEETAAKRPKRAVS